MKNRIRSKNFLVKFENIFLFLFSWSLLFILPHFQTKFGFVTIFSQVFISVSLLYTINRALGHFEDLEKFLKPNIFFLFPLLYLVSIVLNLFGKDELYKFINRFGAGSMMLDGKIYMFGDLAHLTKASSCTISVQIGRNICDPFDRPFNQNPHLVDFLKITHFSDTSKLGLVSTLTFFILILIVAYKNQIRSLTLFIMLLSPPIVLAIDRGNEIITILLLLPGLLLIVKHKSCQTFGAFLLALSCFYKLWPIAILIPIFFLFSNKLNIYSKFTLTFPIIYWMYFHDNASRMLEVTQKGSPLGLSFGLAHYINSTIELKFVVLFCVLVLLFCIHFFSKSILFNQNLYVYSANLVILNALLITYISIWILGTSFIYRLIIFIPIIVFLNKAIKEKIPRDMLESVILLTMLTSKLSITTVFTSCLAIIFSAILAYQLILFLKKRSIFHHLKSNQNI